MNKKALLIIIIIVAIISLVSINSIQSSRQDFDGLFEMNVPMGIHYRDIAYCLPNGRLGCVKEYWDENSGCDMSKGEIVIYYYDDSCLSGGESNTLDHAINTLTTSYFYKFNQNDGKLMILTNDLGSKNMPPYIVGVSNDDDSKVVFVGGYDLNDLKYYANSIEFK